MSYNRNNKTRRPVQFHDFWEIDDRKIATSYKKVRERIDQFPPLALSKPAFNRWKLASIVASVALLAVCGLYGYTRIHPVEQRLDIVHVAESATQVTLSDGTKVWLSAHSRLRNQQTFTGKTRDVTLEGEAYFEVARRIGQPFRVLTGGQTVVVLGTCFNVSAYPEEQDVKIALVEGSVRVTDENTGKAVVLQPAQEVAINRRDGSFSVNDVNVDMLISWKTGIYVFNNITFEEVIKTLEKGFNVKIQIENESLKSKPYTMRFENGESLEEILDKIGINAKYSYQYNNGTIVIK